MLTGDSTRTCLGTGVWSGSDPTCTGMDYMTGILHKNHCFISFWQWLTVVSWWLLRMGQLVHLLVLPST